MIKKWFAKGSPCGFGASCPKERKRVVIPRLVHATTATNTTL